MAQFIKNEFGGYFLLHSGYVYLPAKSKDSKSRSADNEWICEQRRHNVQCPGQVIIDESNQVEWEYKHSDHAKPSHHQSLPQVDIFSNHKDKLSEENMT